MDHAQEWTTSDSEALYSLPDWGLGYFTIAPGGHLLVRPDPGRPDGQIDVPELIDELRRRGIRPPLLLRFNDVLRHRVRQLFACFHRAIDENHYPGRYSGVYPIKVNQQRHVVETLLEAGRPLGLGLEVGSKPELLAALSLPHDPESLLICNGFKDRDFLRTALDAHRLGRRCVVVIERFPELVELLELAADHGVEPRIGLRAKLATPGAGRWESSGGDRSKFGLDPSELLAALELLRDREQLSCLQLLHYHIGSQITAIGNIKQALREGTRLYVELARLGAPLRFFDVGGGLGVDYDGTRTAEDMSIDYTDQEYASDVVRIVQQICNDAGIEPPDLISESGRALVSHQTVLVVDVADTSPLKRPPPDARVRADEASCLQNLAAAHQTLGADNFLQVYHDVQEARAELRSLFEHGIVDLEQRARGEELARAISRRVRDLIQDLGEIPEPLQALERDLADIYYCNFSIFQSLPDTWAIEHLFPVLPLQELHRRPERKAVLADLTCDSDGKVDRFLEGRRVRPTLSLHRPSDEGPYSLGFFLVGAYQEILGDLHNLFGDTNAVHVDLEDGHPVLRNIVEADRVGEVLEMVEYPRAQLVESLRRAAEAEVREGRLSIEDSADILQRYTELLDGSPYPVE